MFNAALRTSSAAGRKTSPRYGGIYFIAEGTTRFRHRVAEVELGQDQDGDAVATCRVEPCAVPEKSATVPVTPEQRRVLEALRQLVDDHGTPNPGGTGWPEPRTRKTVDLAAFKQGAHHTLCTFVSSLFQQVNHCISHLGIDDAKGR